MGAEEEEEVESEEEEENTSEEEEYSSEDWGLMAGDVDWMLLNIIYFLLFWLCFFPLYMGMLYFLCYFFYNDPLTMTLVSNYDNDSSFSSYNSLF